MDKSAPFEKAEDGHLPSRPSSSLALAPPADIALVHLDLARQKGRRLGELPSDQLAQLMELEDRGVAIHAHQFGGGPGRDASHEQPRKIRLNTWQEPTFPCCLIHPTKIACSSDLCQSLRKR